MDAYLEYFADAPSLAVVVLQGALCLHSYAQPFRKTMFVFLAVTIYIAMIFYTMKVACLYLLDLSALFFRIVSEMFRWKARDGRKKRNFSSASFWSMATVPDALIICCS